MKKEKIPKKEKKTIWKIPPIAKPGERSQEKNEMIKGLTEGTEIETGVWNERW